MEHITVLKNELITSLNIKPDGVYVDCTGGGGGHAQQILSKLSKDGKLIIFDRDQYALTILKERFSKEIASKNVEIVGSEFSSIRHKITNLDLYGKIDGICADIGVSNFQIADAGRGFSFRNEGPLDMRMDQSTSLTAKDIVNDYSESEIFYIIKTYGEDKFAKNIAKNIVLARAKKPFENTKELAENVANSIPKKLHGKTNPATKTFQAFRIYINKELEELETLLKDGFELLSSGGRFAIISFHSLEDKIVKKAFKNLEGKNKSNEVLKRLPISQDSLDQLSGAKAKIIKPFPVKPSLEEISLNPKSRSAVLRTIEKL